MFRRNWFQKPPIGTPLCEDSSLVQGLASLWLMNSGCGLPFDTAGRLTAVASSAVWSPGQYGVGLSFNGTSQYVTLPAANSLEVSGPISIVSCCRPAMNVSNQHTIDVRNSTSGYYMAFDGNSNNEINLYVQNSTGTGNLLASSNNAVDGNLHVFAATLAGTGTNQAAFYRDGVPAGVATSVTLPSFWTTPITPAIGTNVTASGAWFKGFIYWVAVWNRVLSYAEIVALGSHPNAIAQLFWPARASAAIPASLVPAIYSVTPSAIPSGHSGSIALSIHGYGLGWTSGTPGSPSLSVSGVPGLSKVSQVITDSVDATLDVATGSGSGTATISDGTYSITFQVVAPTLAVTPATMGATGTHAIALTGTGTAWPTGSQPGLFTISGVAGASISSIVVASATAATATIATGSGTSGGTLTVTDTTTGATAAITVGAAYAGSLHCAGQCLLQHSGGTTGLLSNRSAASLAFSLNINSNAGLNLATGTTILKWTTGNGSVIYYPATKLLTLAFYGQSGNFTTSVPIQVGIGYHFALSWTNGSQVLYLNGLPYATDSLATNTASVSMIQVGANAGTVATDHYVSDLCEWSSYALSANDAAALASKTSTPVQLGTPASLWFPLGGGSFGGTPAITDTWFADFSGNGNSLSVVTGASRPTPTRPPLRSARPSRSSPRRCRRRTGRPAT